MAARQDPAGHLAPVRVELEEVGRGLDQLKRVVSLMQRSVAIGLLHLGEMESERTSSRKSIKSSARGSSKKNRRS
jgi:hypothetical protein